MKKNKTAIFIVPRSSYDWKGNEAGWITTAGWAVAAKKMWGDALVSTTDGVYSPEEVMLFPNIRENHSNGRAWMTKLRNIVPEIFITAYKDYKLKNSKPAIWPIERGKNKLAEKEVILVWERHDLFPGSGKKLANKYNVPLVTSVEALAVWEAKKWGVKRPIWGKYLEKKVEAKSLKNSDLICCVSKEVKNKVISMGISEEKVIVTPNRIDPTVFHPNIEGKEIERLYGLEEKIVIGWTGSFRKFHALDIVVLAFKSVHMRFPETLLMLLGDGLEFKNIEALIENLNLKNAVIMPGRKKINEVPKYVANFDIAIVSARSAEGFHYSPLKLGEYLAAGKAVVASNAGDLPEIFSHGKDLLFYEVGNPESLAENIKMLLENIEMKHELEKNAKLWFENKGSWTHELIKVCAILNIEY